MNDAAVERIINAVLYEGYILYPYRATSRKNVRERFTFGRVYPMAYSLAQNGAEPCVQQTECLVRPGTESVALEVSVRFLQPQARQIGALASPVSEWEFGVEPPFQLVAELRQGGEVYQPWLEAIERQITGNCMYLQLPVGSWTEIPFRFESSRKIEPIRDEHKQVVGVIVRCHESLQGSVEVAATLLKCGAIKLTTRVSNLTPLDNGEFRDSEDVLLRTFASTHTILRIQGGEFISPTDPGPAYAQASAACRNIGCWPVLVGDEEKQQRDTLLSSPIIMYDYPKLAPESAGPLFDGTEIDELLSLRILTLTDEEKHQMRAVEEQARKILERTEALDTDRLLRMHGVLRPTAAVQMQASLSPKSHPLDPNPKKAPTQDDDFFGTKAPLKEVLIGGICVKAGDRVRLRPKGRADVIDLALAGQTAVIEAIEQDAEERIHLGVVVEQDPGKDLGFLRQPGHRFFYGIDEVETLSKEPASQPTKQGERL